MAAQFAFVLFVALAFFNVEVESKVKITVGTTSACSDTINFIRNQLVPTFNQFEEYVEIEFVPWGRTRQLNDGSQVCQFGTNDCWANRMQRCALNLLKGNQRKQVDFVGCDFTPPLPGFSRQSYECAVSAGLNEEDVDACVKNSQGDKLDAEAQNTSAEPMNVINFVPFILFNDEIDRAKSTQARAQLSNMVCSMLKEDPSSGVEC